MTSQQPGQRQRQPAARKAQILIADDDQTVQILYTRILGSRGYDIRCSGNGDDVLAALHEQRPDLLLLDLNMPGKGGLEVLKLLRRDDTLFNLPVVIVSALDAEDVIAFGLSLGANDYLVKPVKSGELVAKVEIALKKGRIKTLTDQGFTYGSLIAGKYEVDESLGSGGYGTVYLAHDVTEGQQQPVAIKVFHADRSSRQGFITKFLREAYAHARLSHPNIVQLLDFGQSDNLYFLVMEYLQGHTLQEIIKGRGKLPEDMAMTIAYEIAKALDYLHLHKCVHRDLKPRNIMVTADGEAKLLDFGMARRIQEDTLSSSQFIGGTPQYLSPEYIRSSKNLDSRSDVYGLGMSIYYAVAGRYPFPDTEDDMEWIDYHLKTQPDPLALHADGISLGFCELVDRMLIKDREDRPLPLDLIRNLVEQMAGEAL